jgi:hypothetical protein
MAGREVTLRQTHLRETDQNFLQLDLVQAGYALTDLERLLPGRAGIREASLAEIDPRVGHVDVGDFRGVAIRVSLEYRLGERQQRNRLLKFIHVRDQRRGKRCGPPGEFRRTLALLARHPRDGVAHQPDGGVRVRFFQCSEPLAQLRERGGGRRIGCRRAGCGQIERMQARGRRDRAGDQAPNSGAAQHSHGASDSISTCSAPSSGAAIPWRASTSRTGAVTGSGRSASTPCRPSSS